MTIYTLGYTGWKLDEVAAAVERLDAVLVDVRMVPRSRNPIWNSMALAKRFGDRYVWLKLFGNRNYKGTFEQIEIVDFAAGEQRLRELTAGGRPVILFCGCPDVTQCHRSVLADWLAKSWSADVDHLTRPDNRNSGGQRTLF